jgi:hypothetical protein
MSRMERELKRSTRTARQSRWVGNLYRTQDTLAAARLDIGSPSHGEIDCCF